MTLKKVPKQKRVFFLFLVFAWSSSTYVVAAPLEDISLSVESGRVLATIKLSSPITNVRYTPAKQGKTLSVLLDRVPGGLGVAEWRDDEVLSSPPTNLIPSFTVKTNLKNIQPKLIIDFNRQAEYTVQIGRDGRSIVVSIKIDKEIPKFNGSLPFLPEVNALAANATETDKTAAALMLQGRNSLASGDNFGAIDLFNKLLLLPPNSYTQDGQEWVGVARERAGQLDKAKVELELYLKLYTSPEDIKRIKLRLATLGSKPTPDSLINGSGPEKKKFSQTLTYGSISMHYSHGASKTDSVDTSAALGSSAAQSSFSNLDQSALLTTAIATERFISDKYDNRLVFQDTSYTNFLPGQVGQNRLGTAYFEVKNKLSDYTLRLGRQSSSGAGVLGRFDGVAAGYGLTSSTRVNAVAGQLSDYGLLSAPKFYGASLDMGPVTIYTINQTVDDIVERKAVGTEIRYFEPNKSAFFSLDYDTIFSAVNVAMLQGTYIASPGRTYNLYIDHRKTPFLSIRNALFGSFTTNLTDLLQFMSEEEIRALASERTGTSNLAQLGLTQQISTKWQIGGDIRVSKYESMPASGTPVDPLADPLAPPPVVGFIADTPSTGNDWAISSQLIGSNLLSNQDVTVFSLSVMGSSLYKGESLYIYSRGNFSEKLSLDASLQFYRQTYESGMLMTRVTPSLRTAYQIRKSISLDMDAGFELSHTEFGTQLTDGQRKFFSLGFRWDF